MVDLTIDEMIKISHKRGNEMIEESRPKYDWIMSHMCRRSFWTNEFLKGPPTDLIMSISGHKTEKAFKRYIKADQVHKAHMIITTHIDFFNERNLLNDF